MFGLHATRYKHCTRGYITMLVLVFSGVFLVLVSSLAGFIFIQQQTQLAKENREKAVQIAEAGLDYYRWFLAHYPDDLQNGEGVPGPYEIDYDDPEGGTIGTFSLDIDGNEQCEVVSTIDITSTGWTDADPSFTRTVFGRYARPSVAEYAYIINSNVWAGSDRVINGRYHSNGGIRMDGDNRSTVTSGVEDWLCTGSFGCSPSSTEDGVFGGGTNPELWSFPAAPIDFAGLTVDLVEMKNQAQANGLYLEPTAQGKRLVFQSDGSVDVYIVNSTNWVWGKTTAGDWIRDYHIINNDTFVGNFELPSDCQVIFAESDVWLEGTVGGKITVASANLINPNTDTSVILNGNINYTTTDGSVGLTVIAEEDVLVPLLSPNNMTLRGIFIAQNGAFGRHYYTTSGSNDVPNQYDSYVLQDTLTMTGTIVSNGRVGTKWSCGGSYCSGYNNRENYYDRNLATEPPPLTPFVSSDFTFVEWREDE